MTSKFGGIPLDKLEDQEDITAKSNMTSKFGGIPLDKLEDQEDITAESEELSKFGSIPLDKPEDQEDITAESEELSKLGYILGLGETAGTMTTGSIAEIISGLGGLAKLITSGPDEAGKTMTQIQEALTYKPKTEEGKIIMRNIARLIGPLATRLEKIPEATGDVGFKIGGPIGGTIGYTAVAMIPEILGLKGTRAARKGLLKKVLKDEDVSEIFDQTGKLRPDIQNALDKADINIEDVLDKKQISKLSKQIGEAAKSKKILPSERLAAEIKPSKEILDAAEEFGVSDNLLASHVSEDPIYRAIEQGLKSVPGSLLDMKEKALIADLSKRADDLIVDFGGKLDKAELSDAYRLKAERVINDLETQTDKVYNLLAEKIPAKTKIEANNIINLIRQTMKELGGQKYLSVPERKILNSLSKSTEPTYARLDKIRKEIGQAINKGAGPFKDSETGFLKQLYKALSEDQEIIANNANVGNVFKVAKDLVVTRKGIEKQLIQSLGKNLMGTITTKAKTAMSNLSQGNTKQFDELLSNIPKQLGPDLRKSVLSTALNDAFSQGSRTGLSLNIPGFDNFMTNIKRNKTSYNRLKKEFTPEEIKRLESFHTLVSGVRRAQKDAITTGRIVAVPQMFDETKGIAARLFGKGKAILPEIITSASGMPGLATAIKFTTPKIKKTARSVAADELLASQQFRVQVQNMARGKIKEAIINKKIRSIPAYKRWLKTLSESELIELGALGAIGYLTNTTHKMENE